MSLGLECELLYCPPSPTHPPPPASPSYICSLQSGFHLSSSLSDCTKTPPSLFPSGIVHPDTRKAPRKLAHSAPTAMIATMSSIFASSGLLKYEVFLAASVVVALSGALFAFVYLQKKPVQSFNFIANFGRFFYASFLKPHTGDGAVTGQQAALESFYKAQVTRCLFVHIEPRNLMFSFRG